MPVSVEKWRGRIGSHLRQSSTLLERLIQADGDMVRKGENNLFETGERGVISQAHAIIAARRDQAVVTPPLV